MATRSPNVARKIAADRRRERDLRHQQQHAAAGARTARRQPQVDLGLAAAGDAVEERGVECLPRTRARRARRTPPAARPVSTSGSRARRCQRRAVLERIAIDPPALDESDEAELRQARQRRRADAASASAAASMPSGAPGSSASASRCLGPRGGTSRSAMRPLADGLEPAADRSARDIVTLRRQHRDAHRARRGRGPFQRARQRDQAVALEAATGRHARRAGLRRERTTAHGASRPSAARGSSRPRPALGEQPRLPRRR